MNFLHQKKPPFELHFLHGFLGNPQDWDPLRKYFPDFKTVAHSLSSFSSIEHPSLLIGYSMGGRAALEECFRENNAVKGIILLSTNLGLSSESERSKRLEEEKLWLKHMQEHGMESFLSWWYTLPLFRNFAALPSFQEHFSRRKMTTREEAELLLSRFSIARTENYWEKISQIEIPIYFLFGERDTKYQRIFRQCGALQKHQIEKCGHVLHLESPETCARYINQFIEVNYG